jgi:hypothetical protein
VPFLLTWLLSPAFLLIPSAITTAFHAWRGMRIIISSQLGLEFFYACLKQLILTFELSDNLVFVHPTLDIVLLS